MPSFAPSTCRSLLTFTATRPDQVSMPTVRKRTPLRAGYCRCTCIDLRSAPALSLVGSRSPRLANSMIRSAIVSFMSPGRGSASSRRHASSSAADIAVISSGANAPPFKYWRMGMTNLLQDSRATPRARGVPMPSWLQRQLAKEGSSRQPRRTASNAATVLVQLLGEHHLRHAQHKTERRPAPLPLAFSSGR